MAEKRGQSYNGLASKVLRRKNKADEDNRKISMKIQSTEACNIPWQILRLIEGHRYF